MAPDFPRNARTHTRTRTRPGPIHPDCVESTQGDCGSHTGAPGLYLNYLRNLGYQDKGEFSYIMLLPNRLRFSHSFGTNWSR